MTGNSSTSLSDFRVEARRLLKQLRSSDDDAARSAAERFRRLRSFQERTIEQLLESRGNVRLKHALALIALENDKDSWLELKRSAEAESSPAGASSSLAPPAGREMYEKGLDVLLNRWFARYDDARASLEERGGFLLPFDSQFLICESEGIRVLGLDPEDPDWERIGWDWVRPEDPRAWQRLKAQRQRFVLQKA